MQTKQQIQRLLTSAGVSPNKRLGQHFLIDLNLMRLLVDSADIGPADIVIEVGCGTGSLTEALAERAGHCIAVECDAIVAGIAKGQLAGWKNVQVVNTDVLETKNTISRVISGAIEAARLRCAGELLLVSNLPYQVASPVILNLAVGPLVADRMYVTVQKEVADRMTAGPGSREYGVLSIFMDAMGDVRTIRVLKPKVFWPEPEVDSAVVGFIRSREKAGRIQEMALLREVVSLFMSHRRKTLRACTRLATRTLEDINNWPEIFERCSIDPKSRPDQLSAHSYVAVANLCRDCLKAR